MDGDIEGIPRRHVDAPLLRGMELRGPQGQTYEDDEFQGIVESFDKLQANEPETVLDTRVHLDEAFGQLAVGMTVRGSHAELHGRANEWLGLLGAEGSSIGCGWSIGH